MQKIFLLSFITIIVTHNSNSFGMLKCALHTYKYTRMYRMKSLNGTTIFNTINASNESELLKNLCNRNNNTIRDLKQQIKLLEQQNDIANNCPLDREKLKSLEIQLYEGFSDVNLT